MTSENALDGRAKSGLLVGLLLFSGWSVYTRYVDLHAFDLVTNMSFRDLSMSQYNDTLAGVRTFPYQWRVLAFWMVRAGTIDRAGRSARDRRRDQDGCRSPHRRRCSICFRRRSSARWARCSRRCMYLFVTAAAFGSEGYAIYFTNDYLAILSWFAGVVALRRGKWWLAALAAFAGAWAKETAMLIVFLAGFEALRKRAPWSAAIACGVAFAIPTLILRTIYPAPLAQWAWWDTFRLNVPVHRVAGAGHRQGAARQPQGAAVPQRDVVLGLARLAPHRRIPSSSRSG